MNTLKPYVWALSLSVLSSGAAWAASDANLAVSATVIPAACNVALNNNGHFDFGNTYASQIKRTETTLLTPIETELRVQCAGPTLVALTMDFNDMDSQVPINLPSYGGTGIYPERIVSGLGYAGGVKIGGYMAELKPTGTTDAGNLLSVTVSQNAQAWDISGSKRFSEVNFISFSDVGAAAPVPISDLTGILRVSAGIAADQGLVFEDEITFEASSVLQLMYL